jgi:hypothetical protein
MESYTVKWMSPDESQTGSRSGLTLEAAVSRHQRIVNLFYAESEYGATVEIVDERGTVTLSETIQ